MIQDIGKQGWNRLPHPAGTAGQPADKVRTASFADLLHSQQTKPLKISRHAEKRIAERNVRVSDGEWKAIEEKMPEAKRQGVKDSVVWTSRAALVVSAENHTVITAMTHQEATNHVFTNINGTMFVNDEA
ncbi:TIGR02530 family flagellar biosynthesis protein [Sinobaca sp. H24]|uniref:TIGR02530 family flagellar biosynthesis protein n=1 Tax=Sinobaca sp. H24 TaxID=2923376 RepID=UPI00207A41D2|nr:TIGR02530 family flagellar biosynthesis protein [Sinobaca sp. H24]